MAVPNHEEGALWPGAYWQLYCSLLLLAALRHASAAILSQPAD